MTQSFLQFLADHGFTIGEAEKIFMLIASVPYQAKSSPTINEVAK